MKNNNRNRAVLIGYCSVIANTLSTLLLTSIYVTYLGRETYGFYQMINAITQYILLFDFGITATVMRFRIEALDSADKKKDENLLAHFAIIIIILSFLVVIAGLIIIKNIGSIYPSLVSNEISQARIMLIFIIAQIIMTLLLHLFSGIAMSEENYTVVKGVELIRILFKMVLVVILVITTRNVMSIVVVDFMATLICLIIVFVFDLKNVKFNFKFHYFDKRLLESVFYLMIALLLQSVATYVNNAAGKTIIGIIMDKGAVAIYSFAITVNSFFAAIPNSMNSVYVPKATQLVLSNATSRELTDLVIKPGRIQYMFCGAVVAGFALFGKFFMNIWAKEYTGLAWLCALILIIPHLFPLVQNVCLSILTALNKRLARSLIVIGTSIINIIVTIVLVKKVGIIGAAIGTAISVVLGNIIVTNVYYYKRIKLNVFRMYKEIFSRTTLCIIISSLLSSLTLMIECSDLLHLIFGVLAFALVYACSLWFYGANEGEKNLIKNMIIRICKHWTVSQ